MNIRLCFTLIILMIFFAFSVSAQKNKKPLTHEVYDGWKSVGERIISNNGEYIAYAVNPQEGDGALTVQYLSSNTRKVIQRGFSAEFSEDSRYLVCRIKPLYAQTRDAKIKKKSGNDMPKDSLYVLDLLLDSSFIIPRLQSFKLPDKGEGWLAYSAEVPQTDTTDKIADSLRKQSQRLLAIADSILKPILDSAKGKLSEKEIRKAALKAAKEIRKQAKDVDDIVDGPPGASDKDTKKAVSTLVLRRLGDGKEWSFEHADEYLFDKYGKRFLVKQSGIKKDSLSISQIVLLDLTTPKPDTIMHQFNAASNFAFDDNGEQLAFVAERDSGSKALQKFYKLWYFKLGDDTARLFADRNTTGMPLGYSVSEFANISFSRNGQFLFFGSAPVRPADDTTIIDFEQAGLDLWHYNDDYLQPQQLKNLSREEKRSYLAVIKPGQPWMVQLGSPEVDNISLVNEGNADWVLGTTTRHNRINAQWEGRTKQTAYAISCIDGRADLIKQNAAANYYPSPNGKFVYWYDHEQRQYYTYELASAKVRNTTARINYPLYNTEIDVPDLPSPMGTIGWSEDDAFFYIRDMFDIWKTDPRGFEMPVNLTNGYGRKNHIRFDYIKTDPEERFFSKNKILILEGFDKQSKYAGLFLKSTDNAGDPEQKIMGPFGIADLKKSRNSNIYLIQKTDIASSELYLSGSLDTLYKLTQVADQQQPYNWLTVSLEKWKMFDGKVGEGLLFKPANFDPRKKYPVIFYFYEKNADGLYNYRAPAPSASVINIPWFVSNGYIVFDPNIYYKTGEPGESAYNSVVSAAQHFSKMPWVDASRMGIQGQSWGGYQVAYLVTRTNIFRAASAGAPVSNMTSAYGGIRWSTGVNRQFQYEKTQSRIGASLWQNRDAYIRNSPLFQADKIQTPLLIMHNDNDGAVPWYQGIELFTALRRLNKKVWLLEYNGEDHNLMERRNRKDLSVRLGQFFDYYLKGAKPADWIINGLPATLKGKYWGTD